MPNLRQTKSTRMKNLLIGILIVSSLYACKSETKPAFDLTNAKKEIEAANQIIVDCMAKGDSVGLANAYTKDGSLMLSNMLPIAGKENLTAFWGGMINSGIGAITLKTVEVWGNDDLITEEGLLEIITKDKVVVDKGKYIVLWKKEDGKWKMHRDISNSNLTAVTN